MVFSDSLFSSGFSFYNKRIKSKKPFMKENGKTQVFFGRKQSMIQKSSIFNSRTKNSLFYNNLEFVLSKLMSAKIMNLVMNVYNQLIHIVDGAR